MDKKEYLRQWHQENKEHKNKYRRKWLFEVRQKLIQEFGGRCVHCGFDDPVCLDFDHIENDGHKDKKSNIVFRVKENPERFQLLCKNCNWRKEYIRRQHAIQNEETS